MPLFIYFYFPFSCQGLAHGNLYNEHVWEMPAIAQPLGWELLANYIWLLLTDEMGTTTGVDVYLYNAF